MSAENTAHCIRMIPDYMDSLVALDPIWGAPALPTLHPIAFWNAVDKRSKQKTDFIIANEFAESSRTLPI